MVTICFHIFGENVAHCILLPRLAAPYACKTALLGLAINVVTAATHITIARGYMRARSQPGQPPAGRPRAEQAMPG